MESLGNRRLLIVAGALVAAIVVVIAISRLTSGHPSASGTIGKPHDRCAVARKALEAFDHGRQPPPEWIQDREAAAKDVRECDRN